MAAGQDTPFFVTAPGWVARMPASVVFDSPHLLQSRTPLTKSAFGTPGTPLMLFDWSVMVWQTADPYFGNSFVASNKDYLFIRNTHATLVRMATVRSYLEPNFGRVGDICLTIVPATSMIVGPIVKLGWMQPDGNIYLDAQTVDIQFLPATIY